MELAFSSTRPRAEGFSGLYRGAQKNPADIVYGSTGAITTQRLYLTKLLQRFHNGLKIRHAAYGSGHEVSTALLGKHITAGFQVPANVLPYVESGDFATIAVTRKTRHPSLPDTPTFREIYADRLSPEDEQWIDMGSWHGLVAPEGAGRTHRRFAALVAKGPGRSRRHRQVQEDRPVCGLSAAQGIRRGHRGRFRPGGRRAGRAQIAGLILRAGRARAKNGTRQGRPASRPSSQVCRRIREAP